MCVCAYVCMCVCVGGDKNGIPCVVFPDFKLLKDKELIADKIYARDEDDSLSLLISPYHLLTLFSSLFR